MKTEGRQLKAESKKFLCIAACCAVALSAICVCPARLFASANSGPTSWHGVTASGILITGEQCPIKAEREVLTFNIPDFISYGASKEEMLAYKANFSAEYTFKNPTDNTVSVQFAFPLGERTDLGFWESVEGGADEFIRLDDLKKDEYKVLADEAEIETQMRTTYHNSGEFDFAKESKRIRDDYRQHEIFSRQMPVNVYNFCVRSECKDYFYAEATINDGAGLCFGGSYGSLSKNGKKTVLKYSVKDGDIITVYAIGGTINAAAAEWRFFEMSGYLGVIESKVDAVCELAAKVDSITFEDYVFGAYSGGNDVSEIDYYNAALDYIDDCGENALLPKDFKFLDDDYYVMDWLVYDLDFAAGQTIINTVTAPLYPGGYYNYSPYVYTFDYLLSPAAGWVSFRSFEIRINTPYYIFASNFSFEKTDYGYVYSEMSLPNEELHFEMCTVKNPEHTKSDSGTVLVAILGLFSVVLMLLPVIAIVTFVVVLIVALTKRKNKKSEITVNNRVFEPLNTFDKKDGTE